MSGLRFASLLRAVPLTLVLAGPAAAQSPSGSPNASAKPGRIKSSVPLSDEAELARVISLYQAGKYAACAEELSKLLADNALRPIRDPRVVEQARVYQASCFIGAGKPELADAPLREAIRNNPQMNPPDSLLFPAPVVERFIQVRESLLGEIRAAEAERVRKAREVAARSEARARLEQWRIHELERLASTETLVTKNSRWLALAPFGVGQFQNRERALGWFFLGTELAAISAAITSMVVVSHLNLDASRAGKLESPQQVDTRLRDWHGVFVASSWGFLALSAAGIAQAQIMFVPEFREVRTRELPPGLRHGSPASRLVPDIAPVPGGLGFSVHGRF